ncbi:MAG: hypothetical protein WD851_02395 [Pirellulales bacterium]
MTSPTRDEFSKPIKQKIAERAGYFCSLPGCRSLTVGPHSDPNESLRTGRAAHIRAASVGGPRYDSQQTHEERRNIENAIWVCAECSDRIDKDVSLYTAERLVEIKQRHEDWIRNDGMVPSLPELSLTTIKGYCVPDAPVHIDLNLVKEFREHHLVLKNTAEIEISTVVARIQVPEPILRSIKYAPPGIAVEWEPDRPVMVASGTGTVTRMRPPLPSHIYKLSIERIPPAQKVEIRFLTSRRPWEEHQISFDSGMWAGLNTPPNTTFYFDGNFQYPFRGLMHTKQLFSAIDYDKTEREMSFNEVRGDRGQWEIVEGSFWS